MVGVLFLVAWASAGEPVPALSDSVFPKEFDMYRGVDADTLDWICPKALAATITSDARKFSGEEQCTLLRDPVRGRIAADRLDPFPVRLKSDLDVAQEYAWAEESAIEELVALGLDTRQVGDVTARFLVRVSSDDIGRREHAIGIIVFVDRQIEGVEVVGNGAKVTFDIDHSLRAVSSTWPTLSVQGSTWSLPKSGRCSVQDSQAWQQEVANSGALRPVNLSTVFMPSVSDPDEVMGVELKLASDTMIAGPMGSRKRQIQLCDQER